MSRSLTSQWMPFYGDDFYGTESVTLSVPLSEALYLRLLWYQWCHGSLPSSPESIRELVPAKFGAQFLDAWTEIECHFPVCDDGRRRNQRCQNEREKAAVLAEKRRTGAAKTNKVRSPRARRTAKRDAERTAERDAQLGTDTYTDTGTDTGTETEVQPSAGGAKRRGVASEVIGFWSEEYQAVRGIRFPWVQEGRSKNGKSRGSVDAIALSVLAQQFPVEEIKDRIRRFIRSEDVWDQKHCTPREFKRKYAELTVTVVPITKLQRDMLELEALARRDSNNGTH